MPDSGPTPDRSCNLRMTKAHALLVPSGILGIIDTIRVRDPADRGYFERSQPIYARYWPDQATYQPAPEPDFVPPVFEEMRVSSLFDDVSVRRWRWISATTSTRTSTS